MTEQDRTPKRFEQLQARDWKRAMSDPCTGDWTEQWTLDGQRASIRNTPGGMIFAAGPVTQDHGSHAVLWTKQDFAGDVRIDFDFERLDTINRWVNILYIQATGAGPQPWVEDIQAWAHLRHIPRMSTYFSHMNLLHISYAAFGNDDNEPDDYVRVRRYPVGEGRSFHDIAVEPDYLKTGLFQPGVAYHMTVIKAGHELLMQVSGDDQQRLFAWDTSGFELLAHGRIGIRHMWTRCSRYANFTVDTA
jgi:hypothetical protein